MNEVLDYLKSCGTFYLATNDGDQPHVRPFGAVCDYDGKLYIVTNNQKDVYSQMQKNSKVEISGMNNGTWIRVKGQAIYDNNRDARVAMLDANKTSLSSMYSADDNLMEVFYLENAVATIYSFGADPKVITL